MSQIPNALFFKRSFKQTTRTIFKRLNALDEEKSTMILFSFEMLVDMLGPESGQLEVSSPPSHIAQPEGELASPEEI